MDLTNVSAVTEFILLGFSNLNNHQIFIFGIFFLIYIIILLGNGLIIIITLKDHSLQTPMYFFLRYFSFLEICYTSVTVPRMLKNLLTQKRSISFLECAVQFCFFLMCAVCETFLLTVMAYDRYNAICNPLNYHLIMNHKICVRLVIGCWICSIPLPIGVTYQIFSLTFCGSNQINHVFCDAPPLLNLACGEKTIKELYSLAFLLISDFIVFVLIVSSYIKIISTIQKLPSAVGRQKAFSTCSSHLIVVSLFFGSGIISYFFPDSLKSPGTNMILSIIYTAITPMLNPMIYSLRNKELIMALKKLLPK